MKKLSPIRTQFLIVIYIQVIFFIQPHVRKRLNSLQSPRNQACFGSFFSTTSILSVIQMNFHGWQIVFHSSSWGKFSFSRFIIQDPFQELKLVEIVMGQLCEYTGKNYQLLTSSDSLVNSSIYGIVFHIGESQPQEPLALQTPHPPKIDEKHRVKQTICKVKRFQPNTYQPKLAAAKRSETDKEATQPIVPCMPKSIKTATDPSQTQPQIQSFVAASAAGEECNQAKALPLRQTYACLPIRRSLHLHCYALMLGLHVRLSLHSIAYRYATAIKPW